VNRSFFQEKAYGRLNSYLRERYDAWVAAHSEATHDEAMSHAWNPEQAFIEVFTCGQVTDLAATHEFRAQRTSQRVMSVAEVKQRIKDDDTYPPYAAPKVAS
jgi:hypothetical protein